MKLDVTFYYKLLPTVELILNQKSNEGRPLPEMAAVAAVATGAPILAVCYMIDKLRGNTPEIEDQKKRLQEFYGYEEVISMTMHHPSKWGEGWYINTDDFIPFKLVDGVFIEQAPINTPGNFKPRTLKA